MSAREHPPSLSRAFPVASRRAIIAAGRLPVINEPRLAPGKPALRPMRHRLASTPLPPTHLPSDPVRVGRLLAVARVEVSLHQVALAKRLGVSERTMQRFERGESPPGGPHCARLAELLSAASDDTWNELVEALELPIEPAAEPATPPGPPPVGPGALDDLVRALADDLDVPARALRGAFDALLAELDWRGLSPAQARPLMAPRPRVRPSR
jgi:DNA-binding XRE family transcriptional regulator